MTPDPQSRSTRTSTANTNDYLKVANVTFRMEHAHHLRDHETVLEIVEGNFVVVRINLEEPGVQHLRLIKT